MKPKSRVRITFTVVISIFLLAAFLSVGMFFSGLATTETKQAMVIQAISSSLFDVPVAKFIYEPRYPHVGEIINFNASASYDPDGYIISYCWEFGDGTNDTGVTVEHSYAQATYYTVRLKVTDNNEFFAMALLSLNVTD
jgi:PKD repeat protein